MSFLDVSYETPVHAPYAKRLRDYQWFGAIPLMFATGSGAELRQPLGLVLVGGLLLSQLLTLFTTPVIYLYFDRLSRRLTGRSAAGVAADGARS